MLATIFITKRSNNLDVFVPCEIRPSTVNPLDLWDRQQARLTRRRLQEGQPHHRGQGLLRVRKRHQMGVARAMSGDKGEEVLQIFLYKVKCHDFKINLR